MASVNKMIIQDDTGNSYYPQTSADSVLNSDGNPISSDYVRNPGYAADTGSANAYSVALSPAPTAYTDGMAVTVKIKTANTGASTLNVNSLGAKSILDSLGNALTSGKLKAGLPYTLRYNGTNFILQGEGGDYGTATQSDVLNTKTFGTEQGVKAGTMPNNGAVTITPSGSDQAIPAGYHNGSGKVSAVTVPVANVLSGTTIAGQAGTMTNKGAITITPSGSDQAIPAGYHNGNGKVSAVTVPLANVLSGTTIAGQAGTMPNKGAVTITPGTADQAILAGYHNGSGKVKGEPNLKPENIPEGMSMFGIAGVLTPIPNLTAGDIVIYDDDSVYNFLGSSSYKKISEKTIQTSGTIRIRFDMTGDANSAGYYAFGKIYINDIARGTERSTNSQLNWFTEDFTVSKGDKIQLYGNGSKFQNKHIYFKAIANPLFD